MLYQNVSLSNIYLSNVESYLTYALSTWGLMISAKLHKKLQTKMLNSLRIVIDRPNKKSKVLTTVESLTKFELGKLSYKYVNYQLPKRLVNLFDMKQHDYNTRNRNAPYIPMHGTSMNNNSFICKSSSNWITKPADAKQKKTLKSFSKAYKKYFCNQTDSLIVY